MYPTGQSPYGVVDMMGNTYAWTQSTVFGYGDSFVEQTELIVCRGCSCDFDPEIDEPFHPAWLRNRVTKIMGNEMSFGGAELVGFRPVLDAWQKEFWPGVDLQSTE